MGSANKTARAIKTEYWPKPIPVRSFDWSATKEGWDWGEPVGHGATEQEAIADLERYYEDR